MGIGEVGMSSRGRGDDGNDGGETGEGETSGEPPRGENEVDRESSCASIGRSGRNAGM